MVWPFFCKGVCLGVSSTALDFEGVGLHLTLRPLPWLSTRRPVTWITEPVVTGAKVVVGEIWRGRTLYGGSSPTGRR